MNLKCDSGEFLHIEDVQEFINSWEKINNSREMIDFSIFPVDHRGLVKYTVVIKHHEKVGSH